MCGDGHVQEPVDVANIVVCTLKYTDTNHIIRCNPVTLLRLSKARASMFSHIWFVFVFNNLRSEVIFRFVDKGGIYHGFLN